MELNNVTSVTNSEQVSSVLLAERDDITSSILSETSSIESTIVWSVSAFSAAAAFDNSVVGIADVLT